MTFVLAFTFAKLFKCQGLSDLSSYLIVNSYDGFLHLVLGMCLKKVMLTKNETHAFKLPIYLYLLNKMLKNSNKN